MANDLEQRRAQLAARMRELNVAPDDPRIVLLFAQARQLIRGQLGLPDTPTAGATSGEDGRTSAAVLADLPAGVGEIAQAYIDEQSALPWYAQAPALSASEAGRNVLALSPSDRACVAVAAYLAWTSNRYDVAHAAALRRMVSDLLRAKLDFDDAQAVKLIKAAVREGFSGSSYSPNSAVAGALKRHVDTRGLSPDVREALSGLRARMVHSRADGNSQGRKLIAAVEAMLAKEGNFSIPVPRHRTNPVRDDERRAGRARSRRSRAVLGDDA